MILLSVTILLLIGSHPLNAIYFAFCADVVKPYYVIVSFNLCAAFWQPAQVRQSCSATDYYYFCRLYSMLDIMNWLSANNSVNSCLFLESGIPVISSFCHLVIISSKYILNSAGESTCGVLLY
jgi:hypothetical protein